MGVCIMLEKIRLAVCDANRTRITLIRFRGTRTTPIRQRVVPSKKDKYHFLNKSAASAYRRRWIRSIPVPSTPRCTRRKQNADNADPLSRYAENADSPPGYSRKNRYHFLTKSAASAYRRRRIRRIRVPSTTRCSRRKKNADNADPLSRNADNADSQPGYSRKNTSTQSTKISLPPKADQL